VPAAEADGAADDRALADQRGARARVAVDTDNLR
jgi:hypothetical protein